MSSFWNSPAWTMGIRGATKKKLPTSNPGPGNYNSALNLGKHNPAWKIGGAPRDSAKLSQAPGPGEYNLGNSKSGPKITISAKPKINSLGETLAPGPGNYNVFTNSVYKNPSAFTMGAKYGQRIEDPQPGPGAYNSGSEFKHNGPKIGTSKRSGVGNSSQAPGPGQYSYSRPFSAGPQYGFPNEAKSNTALDLKPGPGQYQVNDYGNSKGKGCTIAQKYNKKNNSLNAPGPGAYQIEPKRPSSGTKIGRAERIKLDGALGPGPGAYQAEYRNKNGNQIKIGTSKRGNFDRSGTPGPGAYELLKDGSKGVTISGFKGKQSIEVTPGPGTYDLNGGKQQRPCSAKIGKSMRSNLTIGDNPGPGQYYPYQKHTYHFAYSKQPRSKDLKVGDPGPGQYEIPPTVPSAPHYLIDPSVFKSYG